MLRKILFFALVISGSLVAEENVAKVSEAFGHLIGKNLETMGIDLDLNLVVKGLQDAAKGVDSPMTEAECIQAITHAQQIAHQKKADENLAKAVTFLKENGKKKGVVVIEEGKLQYKIEKKGSGEIVKLTDSPMIQYVGKFADGTVFGKSEKSETISLEETIPGFQKGITGMKEGEKRTLFIHPEYGYGTQGYLPPNSLLTFEIEVIKANSDKQE